MSRFTLNIEGEELKKKKRKGKSLRRNDEDSININDSSVANFSEKRYWSRRTEQLVGFMILDDPGYNMVAFDEIFCLARA